MKKRVLIIFFPVFSVLLLNGQEASHMVVGKVSFVSSQNVYVRFKSTSGINGGDTLYITSGDKLIPALVVKSLSSVSCACQPVITENIPIDHIVLAKARVINPPPAVIPQEIKHEVFSGNEVKDTTRKIVIAPLRQENIHGSISVQSYSDLSNTDAGSAQRFRSYFSLDARNIGNSPLSAETYAGISYGAGDWPAMQKDIFSALKIYSLALKYDIGKSMNVSIGRRINPRLTNIGAMDGVEFEASIKRFTIGAVSGFRPDYRNYGFNSSLFQAGGYASFETKGQSGSTQSSLAFMQQMNGSATDRRFLYLQHSGMLGKNISVFATAEVDLYKLMNDKPASTFDLTGLYFSLRYRITNYLSVSGSYDARKNVVYYETYKTFLDHMLQTAMKQGYRVQINYRFSPALFAGINAGYRFTKSDPHPSKNIYGYLTYNKVSGINLSVTISGTYLQSAYMNGIIGGAALSHSFFGGKLVSDIGYHYVDYSLPEAFSNVRQHIGEIYLSMPVSKILFFSVNYEGTFEKSDKFNRIYVQIRLRF